MRRILNNDLKSILQITRIDKSDLIFPSNYVYTSISKRTENRVIMSKEKIDQHILKIDSLLNRILDPPTLIST